MVLLDLEFISAKLNLEPTKVKRKGEPITSKRAMNDDYLSYEVEFGDFELEKVLETFLNDLKPSNDYIRGLASQHEYIL
jgi:hypothetical protein